MDSEHSQLNMGVEMPMIQSLKFSRTITSLLLTILLSLPVFQGCDLLTGDDEKEDDPDELYVKFINSSGSLYTITNIQLMDMGKAGETSQPSGVWSENILEDGKTIVPGGHEFFTLQIDNLHWCQYRLGVDRGNGTEVMLHLQQGYTLPDVGELPITHWGSDDRTVSVTISYDEASNLIYVTGWSDFAGIE